MLPKSLFCGKHGVAQQREWMRYRKGDCCVNYERYPPTNPKKSIYSKTTGTIKPSDLQEVENRFSIEILFEKMVHLFSQIWQSFLSGTEKTKRITRASQNCRLGRRHLYPSQACHRPQHGPLQGKMPTSICLARTVRWCGRFIMVTRALGFKEGDTSKGISLKGAQEGLSWGSRGWEPTPRCRGQGLSPWSGKIPHAAGPLSHYWGHIL